MMIILTRGTDNEYTITSKFSAGIRLPTFLSVTLQGKEEVRKDGKGMKKPVGNKIQ